MYFSAEFLEELSERADIVDIVSDYTQLKLKGANHFGLCPFHSEKTPSFSVSADKQFFHCFGCGVGGDVITFVMRAENLDFTEAVRFLAGKVGLPVPEENENGKPERRARILELNTFAARYFHNCLMSEEGLLARKYLKERGITDSTIKRFGIGYAPDYWDGLIRAARGFEKSDLLEAKLVVSNRNTGGVYDMFRGRVMFPIIDLRGNVIAFGGRIIGNDGPKYLNSPDTPVYNKSRHLFALNLAKKSQSRRYILAEGYMDVISLHQAGFDTAVASLGTSLTDQQARLLAKYADEVVIAYDSDGAGRSAAERAIELLEKTSLKVKLIDLPGAKDPDEYIKKFGADAFRLRLDRSENQVEYKLELVKRKYDLSIDEQRIAYLKEAAQVLSKIDNPVERAVYLARVAETGKIDRSVLEQETKQLINTSVRNEQRKLQRRTLRPTLAVQPKAKELRYKNVRSAVAEEGLLSLILNDFSLIGTASKLLAPEQFSSSTLRKAYDVILSNFKCKKPFSTALLSQSLSIDEMEHISSILVKSVPEGDKMQALRDYIEVILEEYDKSLMNENELLLHEWKKMKEKKGLEDRK